MFPPRRAPPRSPFPPACGCVRPGEPPPSLTMAPPTDGDGEKDLYYYVDLQVCLRVFPDDDVHGGRRL